MLTSTNVLKQASRQLTVPFLHFSGHFNFQMPLYNNYPENGSIPFDMDLEKKRVLKVCGCDPAHYFEFQFNDVEVSQVTYDNGQSDTKDDLIIGKEIDLKGIMADISPSAVCAQMFAAELQVGTLLKGRLSKTLQSDLRLSIRPMVFRDETVAAHFETRLTNLLIANETGSKYLQELENVKTVELYFHLNHYTRLDNEQEPEEKKLTGDIYGYIFNHVQIFEFDNFGQRIKNRRLVAHPNLDSINEIGRIYLYGNSNNISAQITRSTDIEGFYDIFKGLIILRYLDFIPFLDRSYGTPSVSKYVVYFSSKDGSRIEVGEFKGDHEDMKRTGGLHVYVIPVQSVNSDDYHLMIDVIRKDGYPQALMIETEMDIVLESERGLILGSGETGKVVAQIFYRNRPAQGIPVRLYSQEQNLRSPIVATITKNKLYSDEEGKIFVSVKAIDLCNTSGAYDPVDKITYTSLPMNRYYGNYIYLEIDNGLRKTNPPIEQIEIPIRVLHVVKPELVPTNKVSFRKHILPLFSYYIRYYPWLHAVEQDNHYVRFFEIENTENFRRMIKIINDRLSRDVNDWHKMPRSRDFPLGGKEMIQCWVDAGMPD